MLQRATTCPRFHSRSSEPQEPTPCIPLEMAEFKDPEEEASDAHDVVFHAHPAALLREPHSQLPEPLYMTAKLRVGLRKLPVTFAVYLPPTQAPYRCVYIFNHGRAPRNPVHNGRRTMQGPIFGLHALYWQKRGVAVFAMLRPGYYDLQSGAGAGREREDGSIGCGDFGWSAKRIADQMADVIVPAAHWVRAQGCVARDARFILGGQCAGGIGTLQALPRLQSGATRLPGLVAGVNFAGGVGMDERAPDDNPKLRRFPRFFAKLGGRVSVPTLWLYAINDHAWGPDLPHQWFAAFQARNGCSEFFQPEEPVVGDPNHPNFENRDRFDGHRALYKYGEHLWRAPMEAFAARVGFLPHADLA